MGDERTDWRLMGQERFLQGRSLTRRRYTAPRPGWDHDHCEFCQAKFMETRAPGVLDEGYATDDARWVCPTCFEDFKQLFAWTVIGPG